MRKPKKRNNRKDEFSARQRSVESADMRGNIPNRFKTDERDNCDRHTGGPNDWRWYAANPQLITDFASFPYGKPLGSKELSGNTATDVTSYPGVMAFGFVPAIGWADGETSPINVAMRRMYAQVRRANSGATNYDPVDMMEYMIAVDSALMYLAFMKRAYAVMLDYTPYNRYYPQTLVQAMGLDYSDIESNLNDFRGYINIFAAKIAQLWIPNTMSYMARHTWMCEGIYTDGNTQKAQTYLYVPKAFYRFQLNTDGSGMLASVPFSEGAGLADLISFGNSLIEPMITSQDFATMSGDILKAFGEAGIVKVYGITEGYQVLPVYDEEVLSQMENLVVYGGVNNLDIVQTTAVGTGFLVSKPTFNDSYGLNGFEIPTNYQAGLQAYLTPFYTTGKVLNFHHDAPTPEQAMVATRLTTAASGIAYSYSTDALTVTGNVIACGSEIVTSMTLYYYSYVGNIPSVQTVGFKTISLNPFFIGQTAAVEASHLNRYGFDLGLLSNFDWHPEIFAVPIVIATDDVYLNNVVSIWDRSFYTNLSPEDIEQLHTTALLSMFTVPMIGA